MKFAPLAVIAILMLVAISFYRRTGEWDGLVFIAVLLGIAIVYCIVARPWEGWK